MREMRTDVIRPALQLRRVAASSLLGAAAIALAACSGESGGPNSGELVIRQCSIGCSDGQGGSQVSCSVVNVTENQEISILFSEPIDPASLNSASLQVTDTSNGTSPEGLRFVDPLDSRRVVFRPSIEFASGGLSFSFQRNRSYEIRIPGQSQGDGGPFIRSVAGRPNQSRMLCSINTTEGIADITPGNPRVTVEVDVISGFDSMGNPLMNAQGDVITERATLTQPGSTSPRPENIFRDSLVYFSFNELMFLPTVADNTSMTAPFINVSLDTDGNLATQGGDRVLLPGAYEFEVDQVALTTSLLFTPAGQIPSAGADPNNPNIFVVSVPLNVTDIAGNPVTTASGGGLLTGIPEVLTFEALTLPDMDGETFDDDEFEDDDASGLGWASGGILEIPVTGGSGRLGAFVVGENETVTLDTDDETFPRSTAIQIDVLGNAIGGVPSGYPRSITVDDGVFEFASLRLEPGSTLRFTGSSVPRILVRGEIEVSATATIDIAGESAPAVHNSTTLKNFGVLTAPAAGPGGGDGGIGADRADPGATIVANTGAMPNPGAIRDGDSGGGIGGTAVGAGAGAPGFPATILNMTPLAGPGPGLGDSAFVVQPNPVAGAMFDNCVIAQIAGPGGGGGHATNGGDGRVGPISDPVTVVPPGEPNTPGMDTPGGDVTALGLTPPNATNAGYARRILRWENGHLAGGGGGGGGGNHLLGTGANGTIFDPFDCDGVPGSMQAFEQSAITPWNDHSAATGGAGGGALGILAGRRITHDGTIDAGGGQGGSAQATFMGAGSFATPGGGGAGGGVRLRAPIVDLGLTSQVEVTGGLGGTAPWSLTMAGQVVRGGGGANGLVRVEDGGLMGSAIDFASIAAQVRPYNSAAPNDSLEFLSVAPGFLTPANIGAIRPDSLSGVTSCWVRPEENFLSLIFPEDDPMDPSPAGQSWTMDIVLDDGMGGTTTRPFRGTTATNPTDWETQYGNLIGYDLAIGEVASPIVVRFQGARANVSSLSEPCNVDINDAFGEVGVASVTPWVAHPNDLNLVLDATGSQYAINMIRFCVIFDRTDQFGDTPGQILINEGVVGVDNIRILAQPD